VVSRWTTYWRNHYLKIEVLREQGFRYKYTPGITPGLHFQIHDFLYHLSILCLLIFSMKLLFVGKMFNPFGIQLAKYPSQSQHSRLVEVLSILTISSCESLKKVFIIIQLIKKLSIECKNSESHFKQRTSLISHKFGRTFARNLLRVVYFDQK